MTKKTQKPKLPPLVVPKGFELGTSGRSAIEDRRNDIHAFVVEMQAKGHPSLAAAIVHGVCCFSARVAVTETAIEMMLEMLTSLAKLAETQDDPKAALALAEAAKLLLTHLNEMPDVEVSVQ